MRENNYEKIGRKLMIALWLLSMVILFIVGSGAVLQLTMSIPSMESSKVVPMLAATSMISGSNIVRVAGTRAEYSMMDSASGSMERSAKLSEYLTSNLLVNITTPKELEVPRKRSDNSCMMNKMKESVQYVVVLDYGYKKNGYPQEHQTNARSNNLEDAIKEVQQLRKDAPACNYRLIKEVIAEIDCS